MDCKFTKFNPRMPRRLLNMESLKAYVTSALGCIMDYATTVIGLSRGFYETHPQYTPINAFLIFTVSLIVLQVILRNYKHRTLYMMIIASISWIGFINNLIILLSSVI